MSEAIGSLTIKRLKKGKTVVMGFVVDKALYQGWNSSTKLAEPTFSEATGPTVTPTVYTSDGSAVTINSDSKWYYNSLENEIEWNEPSGNYRYSKNGLYKENITTHALQFIKDIASETNVGSDTFYFRAYGEAGGVNYSTLGNFEFKIQEISSSGFVLTTSGGNAITAANPKVMLKAHLYVGGKEDTTKVIKWYYITKDGLVVITTGYSCTVEQKHVSGQGPDAGVYCMAYEKEGDEVALASTFHQINDFTDNFDVETFFNTGSDTQFDGTNPVTINARLVNVRTQETIATTTNQWSTDLYDSKIKDPAIEENIIGMPLQIGKAYFDQVGEDSDIIAVVCCTFS